jgi:hypothetical protein
LPQLGESDAPHGECGIANDLCPECRPFGTERHVEYATLEWVDWFNNRRLLEPIGNVPPAEAEAAYHAALDQIAQAA